MLEKLKLLLQVKQLDSFTDEVDLTPPVLLLCAWVSLLFIWLC